MVGWHKIWRIMVLTKTNTCFGFVLRFLYQQTDLQNFQPPSQDEMRGIFWKLRWSFLNLIYLTIIWIILRLTIDYYVTTSHSVKLMDTIFERLLLANRLLSKPRMSVKPNRNYGLWLSLLPWKNVPVFWCSIWKSLIRFIFVHIWNVLGVEMVINWETWYLQNMGLRLL